MNLLKGEGSLRAIPNLLQRNSDAHRMMFYDVFFLLISFFNKVVYYTPKTLLNYKHPYRLHWVNPLSVNPKKGQTHSNNSPADADVLFECI